MASQAKRTSAETETPISDASAIEVTGKVTAEQLVQLRKIAQNALAAGCAVSNLRLRSSWFLCVRLPERSARRRLLISQYWAEDYVDLDFSRYEYLPAHEGIFDRIERTAYVRITAASTASIPSLLSTPEDSASAETANDNIVVEIGTTSSEDSALSIHSSHRLTQLFSPARRGVPSLAIKVGSDDIEAETAEIDRVGAALCFDIECRTGHRIRLERIRAVSQQFDNRRSIPPGENFEAPRNTYDADALELYLEAGPTVRLTNQYLLYYQVLEYYFDQAIQAEAQESVSRVLRDPHYPYGSAAQIREIVGQAQRYSANANEREQLKLVIGQIVSREQLLEYFASNSKFVDFIGHKRQQLSGVQAIRFHDSNTLLIGEIAGRIYSLRNRVVHAKRSEMYRETPPLWPTSPEANHLGADVALVRYLAQRALICYSEAG